jgi:hypothetical protein
MVASKLVDELIWSRHDQVASTTLLAGLRAGQIAARLILMSHLLT